ncbi:MAG: 3-hydroxybutyrate dehydrogenase [Acidiferrobacteraceae bacterium]|nr:3-hydroxybutyrate dehydrogenase [Acidiferrobacteraceae bacterium]MDP6413274.1 3-hydroxybutyrate dehydrogenase [Arenicellales bacterium]MDP6551121.1 3-hydroxybutyrate dehydrogenase [Arenicellales bacterium]
MTTFLEGKTALVTGSTSGIGFEIARHLAQAGCGLMLNGVEKPSVVENAIADLRNTGVDDVSFSDTDLTDPVQVERLVADTLDRFGAIDILVNNAGIQHVAPIETFTDDNWDRIIEINLSAPFRLIRKILPMMRTNGWGRVINIASVHGLVASRHKSAYVAAKHGLVGLTKTVALETAAEPITCNALCPGYVRTALMESQIASKARAERISTEEAAELILLEKQPSLSFVSPADIGSMVTFLCSEAGDQITGAALTIDGGWSAQ